MKKILSLILCLSMLMGMALPALAAEEAAIFAGDMTIPMPEELFPEDAPIPEATDTPAPTEMPPPTEASEETEAPEADKTPAYDGLISSPTDIMPDMGDVSYTYADGVLTFSGTGPIPDVPYYHAGRAPWWTYQSTATSIVVEEGITAVGEHAFRSFVKVTSVSLGDSVATIGTDAFNGCYKLADLQLPDSLTEIGTSAFYNCNDLTAVNFPESLQTLGQNAFLECYRLTSVEFPVSLTSIGAGAFYGTPLASLSLPDGLTSIGNGAFAYCDITTLTLPGSLIEIGDSAFAYCGALETVTVEEGIRELPGSCFRECSRLWSVSLPFSMEKLGKDVFLDCGELSRITVADREDWVFYGWYDEELNTYDTEDLFYGVSTDVLYADRVRNWHFEDVSENDWFYEYVKYCYQYELMNGTSETTFDPHAGATRAEVVTVLYRMADTPMGFGPAFFEDVPLGLWYTNAVDWAADMNITTGYEDNTFRPNQNVSRQEFLVFLHRFANQYMGIVKNTWSDDYILPNEHFPDVNDISDWAYEAELWSVIMGLQTGTAAGNDRYYLYPQDSITRAELAAFLCRFAAGIPYIAFEETMEDLMGKTPKEVTNTLGYYNDYESFDVNDPEYPKITEITYYYYDDFWVVIFTETDGTRYAADWDYYE